MPETNNPLVQALNKKRDNSPMDAEKFLEYILANFNLVPKESEQDDAERDIPMVQTQESHAP